MEDHHDNTRYSKRVYEVVWMNGPIIPPDPPIG